MSKYFQEISIWNIHTEDQPYAVFFFFFGILQSLNWSMYTEAHKLTLDMAIPTFCMLCKESRVSIIRQLKDVHCIYKCLNHVHGFVSLLFPRELVLWCTVLTMYFPLNKFEQPTDKNFLDGMHKKFVP